jgi:hypothetical protein
MIETIPVAAFLDVYPTPIVEAAERLRSIVKATVPDAIERVRAGWRLIGYDVPVGRRTRYVAWIALEPIHVHLGFQHGILMADPERRLEGAHLRLRQVRYLTFNSIDQIRDDEARAFLLEAVRVATLSQAERAAIAVGELEPTRLP